MAPTRDGAVSPHFSPIQLIHVQQNDSLAALSEGMTAAFEHTPRGDCVGWGIPFQIATPLVVHDQPVTVEIEPVQARWLVFCHTSDHRPLPAGPDGIISPMRGYGQLGEHAADCVIYYQDGREARLPIQRRRQIGDFQTNWGERCTEAVTLHKPYPRRAAGEQPSSFWGWSQTRVNPGDEGAWLYWLWAWDNPHPEIPVVGMRFEPVSGACCTSSGMPAREAIANS